jgi:hypothetical protein
MARVLWVGSLWAIMMVWVSGWPSLVWAADTVEPFPVGASDFEFFVGGEGLGLDHADVTFFSETLAGFGITPRFSGYLAAGGQANGYFEHGGGTISFGLFGTVVESAIFDLDLFLHTGFNDGAYWMAPALEINVDAEPDLTAWGGYLRLNGHMAGRGNSLALLQGSLAEGEDHGKGDFAPHAELTLGAYWTLHPHHQLLVEWDTSYLFDPGEGERTFELGSVALGYNITFLGGVVQWLSQVSVDLPQDDESVSFGIMTGLIATME